MPRVNTPLTILRSLVWSGGSIVVRFPGKIWRLPSGARTLRSEEKVSGSPSAWSDSSHP